MIPAMATHRGADPNDMTELTGQWHVGRSFPGMFPAIEQNCPCPKATCGLAAPVAAIHCDEHWGTRTMRQLHHASECYRHRRQHRHASRVLPWW